MVLQLIDHYFLLNMNYLEILYFLATKHSIHISMRTLKRHLKTLGRYRKTHFTEVDDLIQYVNIQVRNYGQLHGYRWMHAKCIQAGLTTTQKSVRLVLELLDPEGVAFRTRKRLRRRQYQNKGPNYLWHVDSYDKLKPYGININGCIDGFSRYIIWLEAGPTNSDPKVIARYYLSAIEDFGGCPRRIRFDLGTENGHIASMQTFFLENNYQEPFFIYGTSQANQRIESWWSILRKHHAQYWMNFFQLMKEDLLFDGGFLDKGLIQFCFMKIIRRELNEVILEWNYHRISRSRNSIAPTGKPVIMFETPEVYNTHNYKIQVPGQKITACLEESKFISEVCDQHVEELCIILMEENNIQTPTDPENALLLYKFLREHVKSLL